MLSLRNGGVIKFCRTGTIRGILLAEDTPLAQSTSSSSLLEVRCSEPRVRVARQQGDASGGGGRGWEIAMDVRLSCSGGRGETIRAAALKVTVPSPLHADPSSATIDVAASGGSVVSVAVRCPEEAARWTCHNTTVRILATHNSGGERRAVTAAVTIPFHALCVAVDGNASAADACAVRLRLGANGARPLPPLASVFGADHGGGAAATDPTRGDRAAFLLPDGSVAHITLEGDVCTLSTDTLGAAWLPLDALMAEAASKQHPGKSMSRGANSSGGDDAAQTFVLKDPLKGPLDFFFAAIDDHFARRHETERCVRELETHALQIRVVQKRLLERFKDRTPAPLDHLDALLEVAYVAPFPPLRV
jgi:hypothetical protein